jgi:hypothetical protein
VTQLLTSKQIPKSARTNTAQHLGVAGVITSIDDTGTHNSNATQESLTWRITCPAQL